MGGCRDADDEVGETMPQPDETMTGPDGQLRMWQPDTKNLEAFNYMGANSGYQSAEEAIQADLDSGDGSWVPASFDKQNGLSPWKIVAGMALAGTGGQLLATYGVPALISAFGGGSAAGAGGATTLAAATPTSIGVGAAPTGALIAGTGSSILPAAMGGTAAATGGTGMGVAGTTLSRLGTAGQVLSRASEGAASGREKEANVNLLRDTLRQRQAEQERQNALDQGKLQVDQKNTGQDLESQARRQAAWGDIMAAGPRTITPPPNIAARMPTIGNSGREHDSELGQQAYRAAQERLLSGSDKQFMEQPKVPTPPLTPLPNESRADSWMGKAGTILGLISAFRK